MSVQWLGDADVWRMVKQYSSGQRVVSGKASLGVADNLAGSARAQLRREGWREKSGSSRLWRGQEWVEINVVEEQG